MPGQVDGRYGDTGRAWRPVGVPEHVGRAVRAYLESASLAYGAFDFAEDAAGVWWFLECNQGGQFGFVELATGQPIARAVAAWLAGRPAGERGCGGCGGAPVTPGRGLSGRAATASR